ncbi:hypothetical protein BaRGS_00024368, partial [Batillaria attramentaria]
LHEQTYFVPYFFVRRVPYKTGNIEGLPHQVQVLEEAAPRDETGSPSEKRKRKGGKGQQGGAEQPIQQGSTAGRVFTEFTPAEGKSIVYKQGEFDILMIHRHHGILVGEVKSIGFDPKNMNTPTEEVEAILRRLGKAVESAEQSEESSGKLGPDAASLHHNMTSQRTPLRGMSEWWENIIRDDPAMTSDIYERLVARFCGPATTVDIPVVATQRLAVPLKSRGQAAAEDREEDRAADSTATTGYQQAFVLVMCEPNQLRRINSPSVPGRSPGTGKTVVLVLVGGRWFIAGHDVHLLASWEKAHAAVFLIKEQLKRLLRESGHVTDDSPKIHTHFFDFADPDKGMDNVRGMENCLLYNNNTAFQEFCEQLNAAVPDLHLWAAAVQHGHKPDCLQEERLTVPL